MGGVFMRFAAFGLAAASVVAAVYLCFHALVTFDPVALPPTPEMPSTETPGAIVVTVGETAEPAPAPRQQPTRAPQPRAEAAHQTPAVRTSAPTRSYTVPARAVPAPKPASRPKRSAPKQQPVVDEPLELFRETASASPKRKMQPDAGVKDEPLQAAPKASKPKKAKKLVPDGGVSSDDIAPPAEKPKDASMGKEKAKGAAGPKYAPPSRD